MIAIGSLFSGIGGLELGIERGLRSSGLECRTAWQVEIDPFCRRVLARHWPDTTIFHDVYRMGSQNAQAVDVICGGFPCQDLSVAGLGAGLDGERSGLFWRLARIVREMGPRVVVLENVSGLLARGLGRVLGELAALGYDAEWDCVPAAAVGAPHQRDRVFVVAHALGGVVRQQPVAERWREREREPREPRAPWRLADTYGGGREIERWSPTQPKRTRGRFADGRRGAWPPIADANLDDGRHKGRSDRARARDARLSNAAHADGARLKGTDGREPRDTGPVARGWCPRPVEWGLSPSPFRRVDDGVSLGVDGPRRRRPVNDRARLRALGNAVVPHVAEVIGRRVAELLISAPTPRGAERRPHDANTCDHADAQASAPIPDEANR